LEWKRILFAGFEIGGQMQLMAETMRKRWVQATSVSFHSDFRGYRNTKKNLKAKSSIK